MAVLNVYNLAGDQTGTLEVNDAVFGIEPNKVVLHEVLTAELAGGGQDPGVVSLSAAGAPPACRYFESRSTT